MTEAFEQTFDVKLLQETGAGISAYDSPYVSFESALFDQAAEKPVPAAVEDLSHRLLRAKTEHERAQSGQRLDNS